jgi:hypothetical protein
MLAPQLLDQVVDRHDTAAAGQQQRQNRAFLRSRDRQPIPTVRHDLNRSQDKEPHTPDASARGHRWLAHTGREVHKMAAARIAATPIKQVDITVGSAAD